MTYPEEGVGAQPRWDFRDDVTDGEVASDRVSTPGIDAGIMPAGETCEAGAVAEACFTFPGKGSSPRAEAPSRAADPGSCSCIGAGAGRSGAGAREACLPPASGPGIAAAAARKSPLLPSPGSDPCGRTGSFAERAAAPAMKADAADVVNAVPENGTGCCCE